MELGTVFLHVDICPLAGGATCNFQILCSHGCLNAARFWFAVLRFHLQTSLRTAQMKQDPCGAFWPCRTGLSDLGCGAESTLSSLQAAPEQGWCSEGQQQAGGKPSGTLWGSAKANAKFCVWAGFGWEMPAWEQLCRGGTVEEVPTEGQAHMFQRCTLVMMEAGLVLGSNCVCFGALKNATTAKRQTRGGGGGLLRCSGNQHTAYEERIWIPFAWGSPEVDLIAVCPCLRCNYGKDGARQRWEDQRLRMDGCNKLQLKQLKNYTLTNGKNRSPLGRLITGMDCPTPSVEHFKIW